MRRIIIALLFSTVSILSFAQDKPKTKTQKAKSAVSKEANTVKREAEKHTDTLAGAIDRTGSKVKTTTKKTANDVSKSAKKVAKDADKSTDSLVKKVVPGAKKVSKN